MANLSLTRVNQKLAQANALFQLLEQCSSETRPLTPIQNMSLAEGAAFHMVSAYQHYLRELAETYGLKYGVGPLSEGELCRYFDDAKKYPVEAQELLGLRSDKQSWLARLHQYYESLWMPPLKTEKPAEDTLIRAISIDSDTNYSAITAAELQQFHREFVALVSRQRATSAEF